MAHNAGHLTALAAAVILSSCSSTAPSMVFLHQWCEQRAEYVAWGRAVSIDLVLWDHVGRPCRPAMWVSSDGSGAVSGSDTFFSQNMADIWRWASSLRQWGAARAARFGIRLVGW